MEATEKPRVGVILLRKRSVKQWSASLQRIHGASLEAIFVGMGSQEQCPAHDDGVQLALQAIERPPSFSDVEALNQGLESGVARGLSHFLLPHPAIELGGVDLSPLFACAKLYNAFGAIGPSVVDQGGKPLSCGEKRGFFFNRLLTKRILRDADSFELVREIDILVSWVLLLSSDALQSVGGLDGRLDFHSAAAEWCLRAKRAGYRLWYYPGLEIPYYPSQRGGENDADTADAVLLMRALLRNTGGARFLSNEIDAAAEDSGR